MLSLSGLKTVLYHSLYLVHQFLKRGEWILLTSLFIQGSFHWTSLSPPAEFTIVQLYHRSAARVLSELAALQILYYIALVMSQGVFTEKRTFPRNAGPAPHFWETDWQPTAIRGGFKRDDITEASLSQNCGPGPHFWETAPPLKNGQIRGQKHLEQPPKFFCSSLTYTKFTFCKKIGPNRPIQPSAVVRIFHCRSYGVPTTN